ncbi:MAG: hypothetical protein ABI846_12180, partial [Rudaea sp.]
MRASRHVQKRKSGHVDPALPRGVRAFAALCAVVAIAASGGAFGLNTDKSQPSNIDADRMKREGSKTG